MGESYMQPASVISDAFRLLFSALDRVFYSLLGLVYELFFNVASADILSNETVMTFFGRVQLILGVFMLFQLAMTILKGIVNPDSFTDAKSGAGNLVTRIITSLVLLTLLVPINIPNPSNEYEAQVNNNGVLFGTLYSLQHRLLANNTLGRLIFGNNSTDYVSANANTSELKKQSRVFTATIMKSFYRINLLPENQRTQHQEGKDDAIFNANRVCKDIDDSKLSAYLKEDADPGDIAGLVNETCTVSGGGILGTKVYAFSSMPLLSLIVAIIFVFILLSFSVDVAVRAIKLAVLRLIAPIPIIGYMDPKGSKDSSFNAWTKTLTSTYLDLFIRLAAVYFVIFIISDMIYNGIYINNNGGLLGALTAVLIFIGLFVFAKQAPKFIKDVLGLKGDTGNIFSGLGAIAGLTASGFGTIGSGIASAKASRMSDETRHAYGKKDIFGREINPASFGNKAKHLMAGITGGIAGGFVGAKAGLTAKDHALKASMEAMQKRNADAIARGDSGSTLLGRGESTMRQLFTGDGSAARSERETASTKARIDALKAVKARMSSEMVKSNWTSGDLGIQYDNAGNTIGKVNFQQFEADLAAGRSRGDNLVHFKDTAGVSHTISLSDAERQRGFLLKNNENDYVERHVKGTAPKVDSRFMTLLSNANVLKTVDVKSARNADGTINTDAFKGENLVDITDRESINGAIDALEDYTVLLQRQNAINKANDRYSGKK